MHGLILWCGFIGSWLLFAGPVYQAAVELSTEEFERDEIGAAMRGIEQPKRVSAWWWLLPPVGYILQKRNSRDYQLAAFAALTQEQRSQFVHFKATATGWLFVAAGAVLIAVKETYEIHEYYEWPSWLGAAAVAVMLLAAGLNTAVRVRRGHELLAEERPGRDRPQRREHPDHPERRGPGDIRA